MGELTQKVMDYLHERRQNLIEGRVNCIPSPFTSFRDNFVGIEQETYFCITANQKAGKSQFASFMFLYVPILYAYQHPDQVRIKIFYAPLEESKEKVIMRFMRYLLYTQSGFRIRVTHHELTSAIEEKPVNEDILRALESDDYKSIMDFFESHVEFIDSKNPTGIYKTIVKYAVEHGQRITQQVTITNDFGETRTVDKIIGYKPNDPNEYVIILTDHVGLLQEESGKDKRETIKKFSEYMMEVRDFYRYTPVIVQQQNVEVQSMDAYKMNRISPNPGTLADCKDIRYDVNIMLGLTNPYAARLNTWGGYDITKLKDNQRFLEVMLSRDGTQNAMKALYFDGAVSYFRELPRPDSPNYSSYMERVYATIENLRQRE